eukprot:1987308-Pyramimonas_sp.AAC.1
MRRAHGRETKRMAELGQVPLYPYSWGPEAQRITLPLTNLHKWVIRVKCRAVAPPARPPPLGE